MNQRNHSRIHYPDFIQLLRRRPQAYAQMRGSDAHPNIRGNVRFYRTSYGVLVVAEMMGLPSSHDRCADPIFAFHIHEGSRCANSACRGRCAPDVDPFADVRMHYNPYECPHPYHAGDMPPLFGANGYAFSAFLSDRFTLEEIIGRTVILHASLDDFTTQPSGNAGEKLACGEIVRRV